MQANQRTKQRRPKAILISLSLLFELFFWGFWVRFILRPKEQFLEHLLEKVAILCVAPVAFVPHIVYCVFVLFNPKRTTFGECSKRKKNIFERNKAFKPVIYDVPLFPFQKSFFFVFLALFLSLFPFLLVFFHGLKS